MANQFLTLKDITALDKLTDPASVGLVNNIVNVAPELKVITGRPIPGISYEATILTAAGSNGGFRRVNSGVALSAPSLDEKRFNCFAWDCQMSVDEALLIKREAAGESPASVFGVHAKGALIQEVLKLGRQFYLGSLSDPLGPPGLYDFLYTQRTQVDSRTGLKIDQVVDAGGTTAGKCETAWFINTGPQGVHWLWGNGRGVVMNPWIAQYGPSPDSTAGTPLRQRQWNSNMFGFIGTSMAQYHSIGAVINIDNTLVGGSRVAPLTDKLVAALYEKFPIEVATDANICLASKRTLSGLQDQRSVTNFVSGGDRGWTKGAAPVADFPTNLPTFNNIPIVPTDSITQANQYVLN